MYEYIKGVITEIAEDFAVCESFGSGYLIFCSSNTQKKLTLNKEALLYIHFHIADDTIALYGFYSRQEREMFRKLLSVSRIGKKIALSVLSVMTPDDIALAVATDNAAAFDSVSGMGRKTAQRVILELKEKVSLSNAGIKNAESGKTALRSEAVEALVALGYDGLSAGKAVGSVDDASFETVESLIKKALVIISERK